MKFLTFFCTLFVFGFVTSSVNAQGIFLEKGLSGFEISGGYGNNIDDEISVLGASASYSFNALVDIGFSVSRANFNDDDLDDLRATEISPSITLYLAKPNEKMPLGIGIKGNYYKDNYSGDSLDDADLEMDGSGWTFGAFLYNVIKNKGTYIIPSIGISHILSDVEMSDDYGNSISEDDETTIVSLGVGIGFENSPGSNILFLAPSVSFGDDNTTIGITVGSVFPQFVNE